MNLGNTCFMNSVLQALTYCPPLVNYLLHSNKDHVANCRVMGLCMTCELTRHMRNSFSNSNGTIRPQKIFSSLKQLARHFQPGRQEDSHEFLRYVIDNIWKSCVSNWEINRNGVKLDSQSKETTFINQMFGGYHRSQITCLSCKAKSDTYDHFMDFILDIKVSCRLAVAAAFSEFCSFATNRHSFRSPHRTSHLSRKPWKATISRKFCVTRMPTSVQTAPRKCLPRNGSPCLERQTWPRFN